MSVVPYLHVYWMYCCNNSNNKTNKRPRREARRLERGAVFAVALAVLQKDVERESENGKGEEQERKRRASHPSGIAVKAAAVLRQKATDRLIMMFIVMFCIVSVCS